MPNGDQPHEELQRSLRVRHAATTGDEGVDLLSWQAEHPAQIDLLTVAPELRPQLGAKLIPKRRLLPWPQGAATAAWATRFETIGFERRDGLAPYFDGEVQQEITDDSIKRLTEARGTR